MASITNTASKDTEAFRKNAETVTDKIEPASDKAPSLQDLLNGKTDISPDLLPDWLKKMVDRVDYEGEKDGEEKEEKSSHELFATVMAKQAARRAQLLRLDDDDPISRPQRQPNRRSPEKPEDKVQNQSQPRHTPTEKTVSAKAHFKPAASSKGFLATAQETAEYAYDKAGDAAEAVGGKDLRGLGGSTLRAARDTLSGDFASAAKETNRAVNKAGNIVESTAAQVVDADAAHGIRKGLGTAFRAATHPVDTTIAAGKAIGDTVANSTIGKAVSSTWAKIDLTPWN